MALKGLFIGIDRFRSSSISWLSCAKRDASALYALFTDTFGGDTKLLTDENATRAGIEEEIQHFFTCLPEDIVVITFSGHGSDTHELVTYDTILQNLSQTGIPLATLSEWLHRIPSRQLICILDCCFSGGVGAKAIQSPNKPRSLLSTELLLEQLSGEGRLILTASGATEAAWESGTSGHGLLTYHLINALLGVEEVKSEGKISVYKLLDYVTTRVKDDSLGIGEIQHPVLLGHLTDRLTWPVFVRGEVYRRLFPERSASEVKPALDSLLPYGFPTQIIEQWSKSIPELNSLQLNAINEYGLLQGNNILISAPTSSGKTLIGELAAVHHALQRKKSVFLFPLKALVNDKLNQFREGYEPFGLKIIKATGESTSDNILPLMRGQYDICLMTYEKFSAIITGNPRLLQKINLVVIDEVQMLTDANRGVNLEFLLTLIKMRSHQGIHPQMIALSAVIGNTHGFESWLDGQLLRRTERPVPLDEGIIRADGSFRFIASDSGEEKIIPRFITPVYRKGTSQDLIIPLVAKLVMENKKVIVFRETKGEASGCAGYLSASLGLPPADEALRSMPQNDPSLSSQKLSNVLKAGVAFHVSDLDVAERLIVETQFRDKESGLRVVTATTTLAMGINTPAEAVIVAGLQHPGEIPYTVAEYKNIIGRAGRLGFAQRGISFVVALNAREEREIWQNYVLSTPEDIHSHFLSPTTDPRTLILRVLTAGTPSASGLTAEDIILFIESSFGAFEQKRNRSDWKWDEYKLSHALTDLEMLALLRKNGALYSVTPLGRIAGEAGLEVGSVILLVDTLKGCHQDDINEVNLLALSQLTAELGQVYFPMNKRSTVKEPQTWFSEIRRQGVSVPIIDSMHGVGWEDSGLSTLRAKKTMALLLWISDLPLNQIEKIMTRFGGAFDGAAGPIRGLAARTCDILPTVGRVAELLFPDLNLSNRLSRLVLRLELGIPSKLASLGFQIGKLFSRGDYLQLLGAGLLSADQLETAEESELLSLLENDVLKLRAARVIMTQHREAWESSEGISESLPLFEA